jgi:hypothetical protein
VNAFSALVLLLLLVFILQNGGPVQISFFALEAVLPHRGGAVVGGDRRGFARGDPGQPADSADAAGRPPRVDREGMTVLRLGALSASS